MLMIFNLQEKGDDSMIWTIIIIVVLLSLVGIDFWLKSEKKKTISKDKIKEKLKKQKVDYNSKRHKDWVALKKGVMEYKNTPWQKQAFLNPKFDLVRNSEKPKAGTLAKLDDETWNAIVGFSFGRITENQLDEIYKKNEIKSEAKKTVKVKNNKNEIKSDTKTTNKLRANSNECEDIGIVTHYKGKPLTGIWYRFYENTEVLEMEIEMIEGLKNGEGKSYDKSGKLESIFICENDKVISRKHFKNDGTVIDLPVWFDGKVYEKGDTVEYKGKEFKLSALELSIYDLLMGSYAMTESPASQFNPNYASFMINQKNCIEWFRVENPELFEALTATISTVKKETPAADISIENGDKINGSTKTYYDSGELESTELFKDLKKKKDK